jgi:hypothetical protein
MSTKPVNAAKLVRKGLRVRPAQQDHRLGHTDLTKLRPPGGALVARTWTANKRCVGGAKLMRDTRMRCKDASGRVFVLHHANIPSGGQVSQIELGHFLTRGYGPEQQAFPTDWNDHRIHSG